MNIDLQMIHEVTANPRQLVPHGDPMTRQLVSRTNTRKHQQLWRIYRAATKHNFVGHKLLPLTAHLCFNTYGVKFPMLDKTTVVGPRRNAFYAQLFQATKAAPQWNFHKYLIARDGKAVSSFASDVEPGSKTLVTAIEAALQQP